MSACTRDIWVFVDHFDGHPLPVTFELLGEARRLADLLGTRVVACAFGLDDAECCAGFAAAGADSVQVFATTDSNAYLPDAYAASMAGLCGTDEPLLILFPATSRGADLAARVALTGNWPLFPRAIDLRIGDDGIKITRALASGRAHAVLRAVGSATAIVTVAADVLGAAAGGRARTLDIVRRPLAAATTPRIAAGGVIRCDPATLDPGEAATIVAAGRGLGARDNVQLAADLAALLGGCLAGTRVAVDLGWLPRSRQVGQTGKTVRPRLYIACGISGATQHTIGMKEAGTVIAINTDPAAPIFRLADLAATVDAIELLPLLIEKCRRAIGADAT
ncbi:MAG: electron transfer flavoprotein subunit alpha/FixB family protein [Gammaproteobacteria bacterium]|nr:electron transfer flavoprotein subunit alpha/FixB family protein [Gammaproteobacteria bacterium]